MLVLALHKLYYETERGFGTQVDRSLKQEKMRVEGRTNQQVNMRCIKVSRSFDRRQLDVGGSAGQRGLVMERSTSNRRGPGLNGKFETIRVP